MATGFIPAGLQRIWNAWNIRGFMILSLSVQLALTISAPLRQKTSNIVIISIVWSAYFLSDWTAIFAFGLISNAGCSKSPSYLEVAEDLLALWASFLLIHLGGPDTITAFSLEDNALWLRHLVGLIAQVFAFLYIFVKTLPDNKLMVPTVLVFASGVIKYGERTRALYLASLENFKESFINLPNRGHRVQSASDGQRNEETTEVRWAVHFFEIFKGLIVDIMPNRTQLLESRKFFLQQVAGSSFRILSIELNLLYEVFYTKILAAYSSWGVFIRMIAYYMMVAALVLFCLNKKEGLQTVDVWITYTLLIVVIVLDTSSDVMLIGSHWMMNKPEYLLFQIIGRGIIPFLISSIIYGRVTSFAYLYCCGYDASKLWSGQMGSFNLLVYSFKEGRPRKECPLSRCCHAIFGCISEKTGVAKALAKMRYTSNISMDDDIWEYTFCALQDTAVSANEPTQMREIYEARGELALRNSSDDLKSYVTEFEYDESVLFWHIATEICYNTDSDLDRDDENVKFSKILSDYVIYLLVKQPVMMSAVADIFPKRYQDTFSELKRHEQSVKTETLEEFCSKILERYGGDIEPGHQDGKTGEFVLINSCRLVMVLTQSETKWELLCTVWVELLSYAAGHCRVDSHVRLLSEGGEFITFVWLLTSHLGIGPRFPKN